MVAKASIIKNYAKADVAGKVDIICKNFFRNAVRNVSISKRTY